MHPVARWAASAPALRSHSGTGKHVARDLGNLDCQIRQNRVVYLGELRRPNPQAAIAIWRGLKPRGLSCRQTPALGRVEVNEGMSVLGDVAGTRRCATAG